MMRRKPELTVFHRIETDAEGHPSIVLMNGILTDEHRKFSGRLLAWAGVNDPGSERPVPHCDIVTIEEFFIHQEAAGRRRGLGSEMLRQFLKAVNDRENLDAREVLGDIENEDMVALLGKVADDALVLSSDPFYDERFSIEQARDELILRHAELDMRSKTGADIQDFRLGLYASIRLDRLDMNSWDQASFIPNITADR